MSESGERILAGAREALAFAKGDEPAAAITINGHRYISEAALASWGTVEVMVRNPAVSELVSDLESRLEKAEARGKELSDTIFDQRLENSGLHTALEKAEAERDTLQMHSEARHILGSKTRNVALEEAARAVRGYVQRDPETGDEIADFIRTLKSPPTPDQGDEA